MIRKRLGFAAALALLALLGLHLHVLEHVFGLDHDDEAGGKPCQICQGVLSLQGLEAVAAVAAPAAPLRQAPVLVRSFVEVETGFVPLSDSRGPPNLLHA